jgi:hypothetical protein
MKTFVIALALMTSAVAIAGTAGDQPGAGGPSVDEVTQKIRAEYNGQFLTESGGVVRVASLANGKILVETEGELAKFLLYNLPQAPDVVENGDRNHMNYFVRQGRDIVCGFMSQSLQLDPLPVFKCRFVVDSNGLVSAFSDRENIPNREAKFVDFFYSQVSVSTTPAYSSNYLQTYTPGVSVAFQFQGVAAQTMFNALTGVHTYESGMGPFITNQVRAGQNIWCLIFGNTSGKPADPDKDFKCQIEFSADGKASQSYQKP